MNGDEFLTLASLLYEDKKRIWRKRLDKLGLQFSEDIFQDTLLKVYEALNEKPYEGTDICGYWYKSFLNNTKRDTKYSYHNRDDSIDVLEYLDKFPYEEPTIYKSMFSVILNKEEDINFHLFRMYYLCPDLSYEQLEELTDMKAVRSRIKKIRDKLNVESYSYRDL